MARRTLLITAAVVGVSTLVWLLFFGLPRWYGSKAARASAPASPAPPAVAGRKINARLFYVADDGTRLVGIERDVAFGDSMVEQARQIVEAQIAPVAEPLVSAIPADTKVRAVFVTDQGEAFVDLSRELINGHTGGSMSETLTVYTLVNALTVNLPAVTSVQLLIDGKPVDTLVGHVDVRRPLSKNLEWVQ